MPSTRTIASGGTANGTAYLEATVTFVRSGEEPEVKELPILKLSASPLKDYFVDLSVGNNTLALHDDTRCIVLIPPAGNAQTWLWRLTGDTSYNRALLGYGVDTVAADTASIEVNAGGAINNFRILEF